MAFLLRNIAADDPDGTPNYYGIPTGSGGYVLMKKENAQRWETREELEQEAKILGRAWGNAAFLVIEEEGVDPAVAHRLFLSLLVSGIAKCEAILPRSAEIPGIDPITEAEMSALRLAMSQVTNAISLRA